jgi:hypothetical protein
MTTRPRLGGRLSPLSQESLTAYDDFTPCLAGIDVFPNDLAEGSHPTILVIRSLGIKVDRLAVREADAEALFNKHVSLVFVSKGRLATALAAFAVTSIWLEQCGFVVNQLGGFGERNVHARLHCGFMIGSELQA